MGRPKLILVTGPAGRARPRSRTRLAQPIGCPVVSRDAIKEGMVAAEPGFVPTTSDPLTLRTYGIFFADAGAAAARRGDRGRRGRLPAPAVDRGLVLLDGLADLKIIRCLVG